MAHSYIKIKATVNEIYKHFKECPSQYFYIKKYDCEKNYSGDDNEKIIFETYIRHNEIGNRTIERKNPYTLESLEKVIFKKVKEYEIEKKEENNLQKTAEIDELYDMEY